MILRYWIVRAVDGDRGINNAIHYDLINEKDLFGIDSQSGIVFTKAPLDRESVKGGSYVLHIVVSFILSSAKSTCQNNKQHAINLLTTCIQ